MDFSLEMESTALEMDDIFDDHDGVDEEDAIPNRLPDLPEGLINEEEQAAQQDEEEGKNFNEWVPFPHNGLMLFYFYPSTSVTAVIPIDLVAPSFIVTLI